MIKIKLLLITLLVANPVFSADVVKDILALTPDVNNGEYIYQLCATCHGEHGLGKPNGSFPMIAGQHAQVVVKQLEDISLRNRENPTMYPFSDPESIGGEQAIADVAAYIAALPEHNKPGHGDGQSLARGEKVYQSLCFVCHGKQAEGNAQAFVPRLKHQHAAYLLRQLESVKSGERKNGDPVMKKLLQDLSHDDMAAIADYISRIK